MRNYENHVQRFKNNVLVEVAKYAFEGTLDKNLMKIPYTVSPGPDSHFRCCIYHERAVIADRTHVALGGDPNIDGIVEVLPSACDQCPINKYVITETCRGCIANRCLSSCPVKAIMIQRGRAVIDYDKCIECGRCKESCPFSAIADVMRPCKKACPTDAIKIDKRKNAIINYDNCISCGSCVQKCPFGAIQDKSQIVPVIQAIKSKKSSVYAMVAPSFATQFDYAELGKVVTGIKKIGFRDVVEVALGADMVAKHEAEELLANKEKGEILTSSCCPGFVNYIDNKYPELKKHVSKTISPMKATARLIKSIDPEAVVVFIGPCIGKKSEAKNDASTDFVLTFEELAALIQSKDIDLEKLEAAPLNNASYYGRKFAASGGVSKAVLQCIEDKSKEPIKVELCDGIEACDKTLRLIKHNRFEKDFVEGMACQGGCIKGPAVMHYGPKDLKTLESYSSLAHEPDSKDAIRHFDGLDIPLE
ncbi:4Fe-4S dicluster domain-containing protein [Serpentinicella sp. ANB-PHB4]|uniref:4Fe-4S dicluster domain-containing protein n=1 Tax=Serpentinicella sp. ANB-PHB4 TaxID=3074076 RepID=UPI002863072D|nr:4Fe-4S dicluster domain-containing protein [Serpentinicella sp. ANB-PHB4]MDR5659985.1 4Fe-4S dicluster domain-containing protein [Serpentinicella sp. ANB-PHB4]